MLYPRILQKRKEITSRKLPKTSDLMLSIHQSKKKIFEPHDPYEIWLGFNV